MLLKKMHVLIINHVYGDKIVFYNLVTQLHYLIILILNVLIIYQVVQYHKVDKDVQ